MEIRQRKFFALLLIFFSIFTGCTQQQPSLRGQLIQTPNNNAMNITSTAFENNTSMPNTYTCDGKNINPPLAWSGIPSSTKSLALIEDDPDAPSGDWVHWLLWNIPPTVMSIPERFAPSASPETTAIIEGTTSFSHAAYGGPCPPSGTHHYHFKLYALDTILSLPSTATKADLLQAMQGHIIEQAELVGLYQRTGN